MNKRVKSKLKLSRETLRSLDEGKLSKVAGGVSEVEGCHSGWDTCGRSCWDTCPSCWDTCNNCNSFMSRDW